MIYFDNSATTSVMPQAAQIAEKYMCEMFFNPAAAYSSAVSVERDINAARAKLASYINADASELIFTSGGTESNNIALSGILSAKRGKCKIITSAVEHPSVFEPVNAMKQQGYNVAVIGVDSTGKIRMDELAAELDDTVGFVSIMHVNNESGVINDIDELYALIKKRSPDAVFHVDGVQAFMKMPAVKCDLYSISGHKLHAPKGVGALYVRKGTRFTGGQRGGGQENGLRSGTTNTAAIMAMSVACAEYAQNHDAFMNNMLEVKRRLYSNLMRIRDVRLNGPNMDEAAPYILNMSFMGVRGEVLLHSLMEKGLLVSTGSACAARHRGKNRVLSAMGINSERQDGAIRFSFSPFNTVREADDAAQFIEESLTLLRRFKRR